MRKNIASKKQDARENNYLLMSNIKKVLDINMMAEVKKFKRVGRFVEESRRKTKRERWKIQKIRKSEINTGSLLTILL